jgi:predicted RNase H-like HicB family nuclease
VNQTRLKKKHPRRNRNLHLRRKAMAPKIQYEIILYWSKADQAFIAEVPELPGCAADGATYQEALANAEVIIREWIETAQELGRPIPEPRGRLMYA